MSRSIWKSRAVKVLAGQMLAVAIITILRDTNYSPWALFYRLGLDRTPVAVKEQVDSVLVHFDEVKFKNLDADYLTQSGADAAKYKKLLKDKSYYIMDKKDLYRKIAGDFEIRDFVCKAERKNKKIYWLVDKMLIYKTIELQNTLADKGYDPNAFSINSGHRHPKENDRVGGAYQSRHLVGQAIDITVRDINKDGKVTDLDKKIVYDLLDKKIIGRRGGIGRYPNTMVIHYDVRGHKARWDNYKR